ncbi:MAG: GNAT family N-acetyltransferase [Clostridia bacterium]|nr:GNAT family N-acetyltransferase [Clostridia bacterium]
MDIIRLDGSHADAAVPLIASFRAALRSFRGIRSVPDAEAAREEFLDYLKAGYPMFAAVEEGRMVGHIVCRIEEPTLWVEQIYVLEDSRRKGVASRLFEQAEELAASMGEDTVFNYVHPNNDAMIGFLGSKGYTVLNMIEIRKPYRGEKNASRIRVGSHEFDY